MPSASGLQNWQHVLLKILHRLGHEYLLHRRAPLAPLNLRAAFLTDKQHQDLLTQAGFTQVTTSHVSGKNWICALGRKPA